MKQLTCPILGTRPISEFHFGGEVRQMPNPETCSETEWADYVFNRDGAPGVHKEWWYHLPSGIWFVCERNTLNDEIKDVQLASNVFNRGQKDA